MADTSTSSIQLLLEVTQLAAARPLEEVLNRVLESAAKIAAASTARIVSYPEGRAIAGVGGWHSTTVQVDTAINQAVHTQGALWGVTLSNLALESSNGQDLGENTYIVALPLRIAGQFGGTLSLSFKGQPVLDTESRTLLEVLAGQAALLLSAYQKETQTTDRWQYEALFDSLRDPAILLDEQQQIMLMNNASEKLFKVRAARMIGQPFLQLVPPVDLLRYLHGRTDAENARPYITIDEQSFHPILTDVQDEQGEVYGQLLMLMEISHFRRLNENMTLFLQTVSHDLRSPLTAAKGFVDMLPMVGELNEKQSMMKERILTSIVDMTNLVEKVLDAGRLDPEMGAYELRRELCDPVAVVEKVAYNLANAANKKSISLHSEVAPGVPSMNLDEMMLERALVNLVENAIKYTPDGGEVVVGVAVEAGALELYVRDNGLGIPPEKQAKLFERGSRIRREEHKAIRGSGLGLFIVKNVAQQHGGDASVESEEGKGSLFRITIPIQGSNALGAAS